MHFFCHLREKIKSPDVTLPPSCLSSLLSSHFSSSTPRLHLPFHYIVFLGGRGGELDDAGRGRRTGRHAASCHPLEPRSILVLQINGRRNEIQGLPHCDTLGEGGGGVTTCQWGDRSGEILDMKVMMWKPDADCYSKHSLVWSDLSEVIDQKLRLSGPTHAW